MLPAPSWSTCKHPAAEPRTLASLGQTTESSRASPPLPPPPPLGWIVLTSTDGHVCRAGSYGRSARHATLRRDGRAATALALRQSSAAEPVLHQQVGTAVSVRRDRLRAWCSAGVGAPTPAPISATAAGQPRARRACCHSLCTSSSDAVLYIAVLAAAPALALHSRLIG